MVLNALAIATRLPAIWEIPMLLYDLVNDPGETKNLADKASHTAIVNSLIDQLADHMRRTERDPKSVPFTNDSHTILEYCLPPKDVR